MTERNKQSDSPAPAQHAVVPTGYVLVPIKPTKEMAYQAACYFYGKRLVDIAGGIEGISMANRSGDHSFWFAFKKFWRASLANAPQPSSPPPETKPIGFMDVDGLGALVGEVRARPAPGSFGIEDSRITRQREHARSMSETTPASETDGAAISERVER